LQPETRGPRVPGSTVDQDGFAEAWNGERVPRILICEGRKGYQFPDGAPAKPAGLVDQMLQAARGTNRGVGEQV
jgi:hypothetical protein